MCLLHRGVVLYPSVDQALKSKGNQLMLPGLRWPFVMGMILSILSIWPDRGFVVEAGLAVWIETATRRVCREDLPPERPVLSAQLAAGRNEWVGFQVLLRSDAPVRELQLDVSPLTKPGGEVISREHVRVYRQHQIEILKGTQRNEAFRPGWYPDPLIPSVHPLTGERLSAAQYRAMPFDLPSNQTHGFWIDIYVPKGSNSGIYTGEVKIKGRELPEVILPVVLEVWDFTLPRVSALVTAFDSPAERMRGYYGRRAKAGKEEPPSNWEEVDRQCAKLVSEHRMNAYPPSSWLLLRRIGDGFQLPEDSIKQLRAWIDRYHVNAIQIPSPAGRVTDPAESPSELKAWLAAWDDAIARINRPYVTFYIYLRDEPNDREAYEFVQHWGKAIRSTGTKVRVMVVEQTLTQDPEWGDLYGAVDIWCSLFPLFDEVTARQRQELGEIMWAYTALCQGRQRSPWWHIDYPLLNYRVPAWIAWRYNITGLLYWGGMVYWDQVEDPWTDANTYRPGAPTRPATYNGEGTLVYPARPCGYEGIVPSLRLKALRDSIEDFDYFEMLRRHGQEAQAREIVVPLAASWFEWSENPEDYEQARRKLAELILQLPSESRNADDVPGE